MHWIKEVLTLDSVSIIDLVKKEDQRGWHVEIFRGDQAKLCSQGLLYLTTVKPGVSKANHYHEQKTEYFFIIKGHCLLTLTNVLTQESETLHLSENDTQIIVVPPYIAHRFVNISKEDVYILGFFDKCDSLTETDTFNV